MAISAKDVKELRELSGAGIMDCKKALQETDGDIDEAMSYLQKKGEAAAEKKAGRTAAEGLVETWVDDDLSAAVMVEVNCETDFVSQNDKFQAFVDTILETIEVSNAASVEDLQEVTAVGSEKSVGDYIAEQITTIGENIKVRRFVRFDVDDGIFGAYVHAGGQIGVMVRTELDDGADRDEALTFARDVAMHVAAMNPGYLREDDIPEADEEAQREILRAQAEEMDKPDPVIEKIVTGRLQKWRSENVLVNQPFVKDSDTEVGELEDDIDGVSLHSFVRYEVGEGIEDDDEKSLSEEVAEQLRGS